MSVHRRVVAVAAFAVVGHVQSAFAQPQPAPPSTEAPRLEVEIESLLQRPGGLTADRAADRARATSFDVRTKRAEQSAAEAGVDQAALGLLPKISAKGSYTRLSDVGVQSLGNLVASPGAPVGPIGAGAPLANVPLGFTFPNDNYAVQGDIVIPLSDYVLRPANQYPGAKHSARAAEMTARAAELTVASNARILYYSWARARVQVVVAEGSLDLARQHLADAKSRLNAGQASQADVLQVESLVADGELTVARTRNAVAATEDRLRTLLHDGRGGAYEIGEALLGDLPALATESDLEALVSEALRQRPELRAVDENATSLRAQASAARSALFPRLDAIGSALYANPNPRYFPPPAEWHGTWAVGAAISWNSGDAILGGTGASATSARAEAAEAQVGAMREAVRDEVVHAHEALRDAETAISATQRSLAAAEESYRVRRALYRAGQATSTELTDAEIALTRARSATVNARIDLRIARVELTHATGRDAEH